MFTATGTKLENLDLRDFCDVVYSYAINSPESRNQIRTGILGYMFEFNDDDEVEADLTFDGFKKSAMDPSLLAELDAFGL